MDRGCEAESVSFWGSLCHLSPATGPPLPATVTAPNSAELGNPLTYRTRLSCGRRVQGGVATKLGKEAVAAMAAGAGNEANEEEEEEEEQEEEVEEEEEEEEEIEGEKEEEKGTEKNIGRSKKV